MSHEPECRATGMCQCHVVKPIARRVREEVAKEIEAILARDEMQDRHADSFLNPTRRESAVAVRTISRIQQLVDALRGLGVSDDD